MKKFKIILKSQKPEPYIEHEIAPRPCTIIRPNDPIRQPDPIPSPEQTRANDLLIDTNQNKPKMICKTKVKSLYHLTDFDLSLMPVKHTKNMHGGSETSLYLLSDIITCVLSKYGSLDQLTLIDEIRKKKSNTRKDKKIIKMEERKQILIKALAIYHLELRADSKLCKGYIDGTIKDWTLDQIVDRMCQMKYLYDYCDFDHYYNKARSTNNPRYDPRYTTIFDEAECMAIEAKGGYPEKYPWM